MLAPMEGVSHPTFRRLIAERGGVGVVCTEFVRVSRAPLSPVALRREVVKVPGTRRLVAVTADGRRLALGRLGARRGGARPQRRR